jgi:hypothetical protein
VVEHLDSKHIGPEFKPHTTKKKKKRKKERKKRKEN